MTRRTWLGSTALQLFGTGLAPQWLLRAAPGESRGKVVVAVFLRGAADALNLIVPYGDRHYAELRPNLAVPRGEVIDLDGFFGLHPQLRPLLPLYQEKQLAIVHAAGSPDSSRSHFDAQDCMECGTPGRRSTTDGWLNRALPARTEAPPLRAVSCTTTLARTLRGTNPAIAVASIGEFRIRDLEAAAQWQSQYASTADPGLRRSGAETFAALSLLETVARSGSPMNGATYPRGRFGDCMWQTAQLIRAGVGLEAAFTELGGWDHHVNEAPQLAARAQELAQALAAFSRDLGSRMQDVVVVTMTEFGRTACENGARGTDHGHAGFMFVTGGGTRGGQVLGRWPGLAAEQLYEGRDLAVTTDYRDVLSSIVRRQYGQTDLASVFPGYTQVGANGLLL